MAVGAHVLQVIVGAADLGGVGDLAVTRDDDVPGVELRDDQVGRRSSTRPEHRRSSRRPANASVHVHRCHERLKRLASQP